MKKNEKTIPGVSATLLMAALSLTGACKESHASDQTESHGQTVAVQQASFSEE